MIKEQSNIGCAILAGGENRRMKGINKAFIKINKNSILDNIFLRLRLVFDDIIIVTNNPDEYFEYKDTDTIISDIVKNIGPLGGIYSALQHTTYAAIFVVACDMPYLNVELIQNQIATFSIEKPDILVPRIGQNIEPLHAIYSKKIKKKLLDFINQKNNNKIRRFYENVDVKFFDLPNTEKNKKSFININSFDDLN